MRSNAFGIVATIFVIIMVIAWFMINSFTLYGVVKGSIWNLNLRSTEETNQMNGLLHEGEFEEEHTE